MVFSTPDYKTQPKTSMGRSKEQGRRISSPLDNPSQHFDAAIPQITPEEEIAAVRAINHFAIIHGQDGIENVYMALGLI